MKTEVWRHSLGFAVIVFAAVCLLGVIAPPAAYCAEAIPPTQEVGVYRLLVGDFEVVALSDGTNKRAVEQMAGLLTGDQAMLRQRLLGVYPDGQLPGAVNTFLIDTGEKIVLIDTGNGKIGSAVMGKVVGNLLLAGYRPEQIDEIYLTHMHGDHIGGLVAGTERVFPNAIIYVQQAEAEYWLNESNLETAPAAAKRTFQAVKAAITPYVAADQFKTFAGNCQLRPGMRSEMAFGHTPGHTAYLIESKGQALLLWGDIIHAEAVQFENPAIAIAFDSDKGMAVQTRQRLLADIAARGWLVGGVHLAFPGIGRVQADPQQGYRFLPLQ